MKPNETTSGSDLLTGDECAARLRVCRRTWDRYVEQGVMPKPLPIGPGRLKRWRREDIDAALSAVDQGEAVK